MLNCKQGDLAIITRSTCGNEGRIVRCVRFLGIVPGFMSQDRWEVDVKLPKRTGGTANHHPDAWLKPLRLSDDADEMIRIVGKPVDRLSNV